MFTGVIEDTGRVLGTRKRKNLTEITVEKPAGWTLKLGDSVAVNGVCLTVAAQNRNLFKAELMPETLARTTFGIRLPPRVNLERPLALGDRLNGHIVQGHIDAVGKILNTRRLRSSAVYQISFPARFGSLIVFKGSIAIDGISLTVSNLDRAKFSVSLVRYTLTHTTIGSKRAGDFVNLEFDILAKYLARIARPKNHGAKR